MSVSCNDMRNVMTSQVRYLLTRGYMHSLLVAMSSFINKKPCVTNLNNFIQSCQVYIFVVINHKLMPAFMRNIFLITLPICLRKCIMFTYNYKLPRWLLADASAKHVTQSRGTLVPHLVIVSYSIAQLAIKKYLARVPRAVQAVHQMLTLDSKRIEKAFPQLVELLTSFFFNFPLLTQLHVPRGNCLSLRKHLVMMPCVKMVRSFLHVIRQQIIRQ